MAQPGSVIAFDLYGTLLSTESISKRLGEITGSHETGTQIAASWKKYQLEYSWRLTCMGKLSEIRHIKRFADHGRILRRFLQHHPQCIETCTIYPRQGGTNQAPDGRIRPSTFPDVTPALRNLATRPDIKAVIFSNGTKQMVSNSVFRSQSFASCRSIQHSQI